MAKKNKARRVARKTEKLQKRTAEAKAKTQELKKQSELQKKLNEVDKKSITRRAEEGLDRSTPPAIENAPKKAVTRIDARPEAPNTMSLGDIVKEKPEEVSMSTLSGKDPKTEVETQIIDKATTYNEAANAPALANAVAEETDAVNKEADKNNFEVDIEQAKNIKDKNDKAASGETTVVQQGYESYDGDGSALGKTAKEGTGRHTLTDDEFNRASAEHKGANAAAKAAAPSAAIEKLGIEHYFPPQQDYVTSNFTGRYIGSRQLIASAGALYPEGLVDARKRAVELKAKAKVEAENKFWELTSTAPQYDEHYKDIGMDILEKYGEASGWDYDGLMTGNSKLAREYRRELYDHQSRGKHLMDIDASVNALVEKMNKGDEYMPPEIIKYMMDFRAGADDLDAFMKGEAMGDDKIRALDNSLRSFQNFTPLANKQLELLASHGANKLPLAKGADIMSPTFASDLQSAIEKNKYRDYDDFRSAMVQFYDVGEIETIVSNMYQSNNLWSGATPEENEEILQNGVRYFMSVLPDKVDIEHKLQNTKNLGWDELAQRKREHEFDKTKYINEIESMWDGVNNEMLGDQMKNGAINALSLGKDPKTKADALAKYFNNNKKTPYNLGGATVAYVPTTGKTLAEAPASKLQVLGSDNKLYSPEKLLKIRQDRLASYQKSGNQKQETLDDLAADIVDLQYIVDAGNNGKNLQHQVSGRFAGYGVYDQTTNNITPVEFYKGEVTDQNMRNLGYETGQVSIISDEVDDKGQQKVRASRFNLVNTAVIEDKAVRRSWADREGYSETRKGKLYKSDETKVVGTSSGSGSSE